MQKLAVVLTTQEECQIYNNRRGEQGRYKYPAEFFDNKEGMVMVHDKNGSWGNIDWHTRNGYKIISLQEAIGDKEIIREGEARGFEPKTWDFVLASDDKEVWDKKIFIAQEPSGKYICVTDDFNGDNMLDYKQSMHYEVSRRKYIKPIEEPKEGWIDKALSELVWLDGKSIDDIKEAIEKHMPKQLKITMEELEYPTIVLSGNNVILRDKVYNLLKSKGLLE